MSVLVFISIITFVIGCYYGVKRGVRDLAEKKVAEMERRNNPPKGRKRRVDVSEDAPTELSQAELKAMGSWFKE